MLLVRFRLRFRRYRHSTVEAERQRTWKNCRGEKKKKRKLALSPVVSVSPPPQSAAPRQWFAGLGVRQQAGRIVVVQRRITPYQKEGGTKEIEEKKRAAGSRARQSLVSWDPKRVSRQRHYYDQIRKRLER